MDLLSPFLSSYLTSEANMKEYGNASQYMQTGDRTESWTQTKMRLSRWIFIRKPHSFVSAAGLPSVASTSIHTCAQPCLFISLVWMSIGAYTRYCLIFFWLCLGPHDQRNSKKFAFLIEMRPWACVSVRENWESWEYWMKRPRRQFRCERSLCSQRQRDNKIFIFWETKNNKIKWPAREYTSYPCERRRRRCDDGDGYCIFGFDTKIQLYKSRKAKRLCLLPVAACCHRRCYSILQPPVSADDCVWCVLCVCGNNIRWYLAYTRA